jgi:zinc transport system ATP-binding protein
MTKILEVKNVHFNYDEQLILNNVSLDVYKGDYLGLIGPNGSAKSTLLKLILGILKPYKGTIQIFGEDIDKFKQWEKIGYVSQKAASFNKSFPATVEEIVGANLIVANKKKKKSDNKNDYTIDRVLEIVKMLDYKNRLIGNLSGGQQQRIFIAKALISEPELLLLDEPTVGVDLASQELFYDIIGKLNKELSMTIILVSHDIGVITEKVNRVACMGNKKLYTDCSDSNVGVHDFIKNIYGEKIKVIDHHHE